MHTKEARNKILGRLSDFDVISVVQVGSITWGCENSKDTDYLVLVKGGKHPFLRRKWISGINADLFIVNDLNTVRPMYWRAYVKASQNGDGLVYGELPRTEWGDVSGSILKNSYVFCLSELSKMLSYPETYPVPSKCSYYIWLNYYTEINGSFSLTDEQRTKIQRIHDKQGTLQDLIDIKNKYEMLLGGEVLGTGGQNGVHS